MNQPATWIGRKPFARPLERGREQRFLGAILGRREVAIPPNHRAKHRGSKLTHQLLGTIVHGR
jgi:hypothetical protein